MIKALNVNNLETFNETLVVTSQKLELSLNKREGKIIVGSTGYEEDHDWSPYSWLFTQK